MHFQIERKHLLNAAPVRRPSLFRIVSDTCPTFLGCDTPRKRHDPLERRRYHQTNFVCGIADQSCKLLCHHVASATPTNRQIRGNDLDRISSNIAHHQVSSEIHERPTFIVSRSERTGTKVQKEFLGQGVRRRFHHEVAEIAEQGVNNGLGLTRRKTQQERLATELCCQDVGDIRRVYLSTSRRTRCCDREHVKMADRRGRTILVPKQLKTQSLAKVDGLHQRVGP
mmetsp:Transcript_31211/g.83053  ORF Transcript_31211/g.83053 Transcript_31211/m.83053 type:complete len:226 (+) Transcript_31211:360-1037(+)